MSNCENKAVLIEETDQLKEIEYIQKGLQELPVRHLFPPSQPVSQTIQSWDWEYGQTPEFTYTIQNSFSWGDAVCDFSQQGSVQID